MPMKLPKGFGNVSKLPGARRRPWRARKTIGWKNTEDGRSVQQYVTIGYYATRQEALKALAEYNENPYSLSASITFAEVYKRWSSRKYNNISMSNISGYQAAYKLCTELYNMRFADIKLIHLQSVADASGKNYPTLKKLKILFNQLFDYAVQNEIIGRDRHIVEYLDIGKPQKSEKHYRFTDAEIEVMWRWAPGNPYVQVILMLIYSGVRPGELFAVKKSAVNLDERSFFIEKGKNEHATRKVPIHDRTLPFFESRMQADSEYLITRIDGKPIPFASNHAQFVETYWDPILSEMGILRYRNDRGTEQDHSPDDTRHTFTTMWKEKKLDESMRRKIQGHSGKGIGEIVYTHFEFEMLRAELNKL